MNKVTDPTPAPPLEGRGVPHGVPAFHLEGREVPHGVPAAGKAVATPLPCRESTEKVHNVKWINNWTLLTGLLRNVKLLHIINVKYLRISLIFSTLAENFCYVRKLSTNPIK